VEGVTEGANLVGGEELVCGCWAAGMGGGEVEEVFIENFNAGETGSGSGSELLGKLVGPCSLLLLVNVGEG
jgi:hypothetical protein